MLNEEVYIEIHWSNNPIPIDEIVDSSNLIFEIPFGVFTPYPVSPVNSVQGKIGDIQLTAAEVNADESGTAQNLFEALDEQKLNKIDYVQHFRGLYDSFADLIAAITIGTDGDYAQIKESQNFGRLEAIWSGSILGWSITGANASSTTDTVAEGNNNLYFKAERVLQTPMTGLPVVAPSKVLSTDELLTAVAKLQAQLNPVWVDISTLSGFWANPKISLATSKIEITKMFGMLWIRGYLSTTGSVNLDSVLIEHTDNNYVADYSYWGSTLQFNYERILKRILTHPQIGEPQITVNQVYSASLARTYLRLKVATSFDSFGSAYMILEPVCIGKALIP